MNQCGRILNEISRSFMQLMDRGSIKLKVWYFVFSVIMVKLIVERGVQLSQNVIMMPPSAIIKPPINLHTTRLKTSFAPSKLDICHQEPFVHFHYSFGKNSLKLAIKPNSKCWISLDLMSPSLLCWMQCSGECSIQYWYKGKVIRMTLKLDPERKQRHKKSLHNRFKMMSNFLLNRKHHQIWE